MDKETIKSLIEKARDEFRIPPFISDESLTSYCNEGYRQLIDIAPIAKVEEDETFQMLLKNYIFYAYNSIVNEFYKNYSNSILGWQMSYVKGVE